MATLSAMLCRLTFLVGCAGSTSIVAFACLFGTVDPDDVKERFVASTGYSLEFATLSEPRPGCVLLSDVRLVDPETGEVAFDCRTAEIESNGTDVGVAVSDATLATPRLADLRELSEELLARFAGDDAATVWIELGSVSFDAVERERGIDLPAETFRDVSIRLRRSGAGEEGRRSELIVQFRRSDLPEAERAEVSLERFSDGGVVRSTWRIDAGREGLPCTFLARWAPELTALGPNARFRGKATFSDDAAGGAGEMAGTFDGVDFYHLVTARFPHKLAGEAEIAISHCRWSAGRLNSLTAVIAAGEGRAGRSLVEAFRDSLDCRTPASAGLSEISPFVEFRDLRLAMELTEDGRCRLAGLLQPTGTILRDEQGPLLSDGSQDYLPVARLVQALAPQSDLQVPATEATRSLVGWLPLADASVADESASPRAVLRMED